MRCSRAIAGINRTILISLLPARQRANIESSCLRSCRKVVCRVSSKYRDNCVFTSMLPLLFTSINVFFQCSDISYFLIVLLAGQVQMKFGHVLFFSIAYAHDLIASCRASANLSCGRCGSLCITTRVDDVASLGSFSPPTSASGKELLEFLGINNAFFDRESACFGSINLCDTLP